VGRARRSRTQRRHAPPWGEGRARRRPTNATPPEAGVDLGAGWVLGRPRRLSPATNPLSGRHRSAGKASTARRPPPSRSPSVEPLPEERSRRRGSGADRAAGRPRSDGRFARSPVHLINQLAGPARGSTSAVRTRNSGPPPARGEHPDARPRHHGHGPRGASPGSCPSLPASAGRTSRCNPQPYPSTSRAPGLRPGHNSQPEPARITTGS
jgi:hypothetical protein